MKENVFRTVHDFLPAFWKETAYNQICTFGDLVRSIVALCKPVAGNYKPVQKKIEWPTEAAENWKSKNGAALNRDVISFLKCK